jgi:hypothetical protein
VFDLKEINVVKSKDNIYIYIYIYEKSEINQMYCEQNNDTCKNVVVR